MINQMKDKTIIFSNMYKKIILILTVGFLLTNLSYSQYKNWDKDKSKLNRTTNNLILGIFNPKNFSMQHSFQVSMVKTQYGYVSLTSYLNSLNYKISDNMNISADVKLQYSPFVSSTFGKDYSDRLQKDLSGLTLSRLSFDYKISDDAYFKLEYRNLDGSEYYDDFYNPFSRYDGLYNSNWH